MGAKSQPISPPFGHKAGLPPSKKYLLVRQPLSLSMLIFFYHIIQGNFTLLLPATASTVETVNNAQLLHNPSALTTSWPYTRRELSCRISPSRPGIRSLFLCAFFQFQHVLVEVRHKQSVLNHTVFFKFCLSMKLRNFCRHFACVL